MFLKKSSDLVETILSLTAIRSINISNYNVPLLVVVVVGVVVVVETVVSVDGTRKEDKV
jgi:Na+/glutamate symporter